jgi:hypothetical protein
VRKAFGALCFFLEICLPLGAQEMKVSELSQFLWKNRLVVTSGKTAYLAQTKVLVSADKDLCLRDVLIIQRNDGDQVFKGLSEKFLLIGKDGSIKRKSSKPFKVKELIEAIDQMSMRQIEAKSDHLKCLGEQASR